MISSIRPPLGATKGSWPWRKTGASWPVQYPECWQVPRLSKMVTCCPAWVSRRSGTRPGSLAAVNPVAAWLPSHSGLIFEPPQRHSASCGRTLTGWPSQSTRLPTPVTR